jgi:AcrR family transcriptional regulator
MTIPAPTNGDVSSEAEERVDGEVPTEDCQWSKLGPAAKRERLLSAAADVFATVGLDASMPAVAAKAGSGVASIYRQFPSKYELLAALVVRRLDQITEEAAYAEATAGDRWSALEEMLWRIVERQAYDDFLGEARVHVAIPGSRRRPIALPTRLTGCSPMPAPRESSAPTPRPSTSSCCSPPRVPPSRSSRRRGGARLSCSSTRYASTTRPK